MTEHLVVETCKWDESLEAVRVVSDRDPVGRVICYTTGPNMTAMVTDALIKAGYEMPAAEPAS